MKNDCLIFPSVRAKLKGLQRRHLINSHLLVCFLLILFNSGPVNAQVSWFVHITDTHIGESAPYEPKDKTQWTEAVSSIVNDCNQVIKPLLVVNTGDLVTYGRGKNFAAYKEIISRLQAPILNCPGNHDFDGDTTTFSRSIGPTHQQLKIDDLQFVCTNTRDFLGERNPETEVSWLTASLNTSAAHNARVRIICGHYPLYITEQQHVGGKYLRKDFQMMGSNRELFIHNLRIGEADVYLSGHVHGNSDQVCLISGTRHLVTGSGAYGTYRIIVVDGTSIGTKVASANQWPLVIVTQPTAYVPGSSAIHRGVIKVRAKVFAKGLVEKVTCNTDGISITSLRPGVDGIWETELNTTEMKPGLHNLSVEAIDEESKKDISEISFVVHK